MKRRVLVLLAVSVLAGCASFGAVWSAIKKLVDVVDHVQRDLRTVRPSDASHSDAAVDR